MPAALGIQLDISAIMAGTVASEKPASGLSGFIQELALATGADRPAGNDTLPIAGPSTTAPALASNTSMVNGIVSVKARIPTQTDQTAVIPLPGVDLGNTAGLVPKPALATAADRPSGNEASTIGNSSTEATPQANNPPATDGNTNVDARLPTQPEQVVAATLPVPAATTQGAKPTSNDTKPASPPSCELQANGQKLTRSRRNAPETLAAPAPALLPATVIAAPFGPPDPPPPVRAPTPQEVSQAPAGGHSQSPPATSVATAETVPAAAKDAAPSHVDPTPATSNA
ncbi:MAG: hypothetical protein JO227_09055, partial [Acetobacteraceae bacterium]|nr:hypothetical protein [Acetobacteraceae bacterium]